MEAGQPPRRPPGHAARRQGPRAARPSRPGAHRLPVRLPDDDPRHRRHEPRIRRLRPDEAGDRRAPRRRACLRRGREAAAYALWKLQERGRMFVDPGEPLYEGMVIGLHARDNDLVVNPVKTKQLTNIRAAGKDETILLTPPIRHTLESAIEFIADDELVEITPKSIRIRKRFLREHERKRSRRTEQHLSAA